MSKKNKKQEVVAPVVKPSVVTLSPLQIVQPVDVCQTFNSVSSAWEEPAPAPVKTKKKVSGFRKFLRFLLVLVLLAVAYAVAAYFVPALPLHDVIAGFIA